MRTLLFLLILLGCSGTAFARLQVFACEPEWAALAREIGGDQVETFSATTANALPPVTMVPM